MINDLIEVHPTRLTGEMLPDGEGGEYPESELIEGYHVNTTAPVEAFAEYEVTPSTPQTVFAGAESGVVTYFYSFPDEDTFNALMESVNEQT